MATQDIAIKIKTPTGVTIAEALRLFTDNHQYQEKIVDESGNEIDNPQKRGAFAKEIIAKYVQESIKTQQRLEAERAITLGEEIIVE